MYFGAHLNSLRGKSCSFFAVSRLTNCIPPWPKVVATAANAASHLSSPHYSATVASQHARAKSCKSGTPEDLDVQLTGAVDGQGLGRGTQ